MIKTRAIPLLTRILAAVFVTTMATASVAETPQDGMVEISLLSGWRMDNGNHMAALRVALAPGWHTYWRAPGAAGIPPRFEWTGSTNVSGVQFHWPVPELYEQNGMQFLGYERELILPMEFTPNAEGDLVIKGQIELGVCEDVCIPVTAFFEGALSDFGNALQDLDTQSISAALDNQPTRISGARCAAEAISDGMKISATVTVPPINGPEMAVLEHPNADIWVSEAMSTRTGRAVTVQSEMVPPNAAPFFVDRSQLKITVIGGGKAYEAFGCTAG